MDRPKCFFDLGPSGCPRFPLLHAWERSAAGKLSKRFERRNLLWRHMENTERANADRNPPEMRAVIFRIYGDNEVYQGA